MSLLDCPQAGSEESADRSLFSEEVVPERLSVVWFLQSEKDIPSSHWTLYAICFSSGLWRNSIPRIPVPARRKENYLLWRSRQPLSKSSRYDWNLSGLPERTQESCRRGQVIHFDIPARIAIKDLRKFEISMNAVLPQTIQVYVSRLLSTRPSTRASRRWRRRRRRSTSIASAWPAT